MTFTVAGGGSRSAVQLILSVRSIARTITAVIESGSGVTSVRPFTSSIDLSVASLGISIDTVYSVKPVVHATDL